MSSAQSDLAVVAMEHGGVPCAVLADGVVDVGRDDDAGAASALWSRDHPDGRRSTRLVVLRAPGAPRAIRASAVRMQVVSEGAITPLDPLLIAVLSMPYVVGIVEVDGALRWLIDPRAMGEP